MSEKRRVTGFNFSFVLLPNSCLCLISCQNRKKNMLFAVVTASENDQVKNATIPFQGLLVVEKHFIK